MYNFSNGNSFEEILERCLARIDNTLDKRQGSIIYDALAPACAELAQCYIALDVYTDQTYLLTATQENLDNRVVDYGLSRLQATNAEKIINIYSVTNELMDVDIGTRFSTPNEYGGYTFELIEKQSDGVYIGRCETPGTVGNAYIGTLLPLTSINNLGKAVIVSTYKPGEDTETDEDLRARAIKKINQEAFAGNKASYVDMVDNIDGVTKCKIFPIWHGGGTVKVSIIAANNTIPSTEFVNQVQTIIDPIPNQGEGVGLAPIGHTVTVEAPTRLDINIEATLTLHTGYTLEQVTDAVETAIADYISEVQENWVDTNNLIVYQSKLIAAILSVSAIENVSNLLINGSASDLTIAITGTNVVFPILNEVVLNES